MIGKFRIQMLVLIVVSVTLQVACTRNNATIQIVHWNDFHAQNQPTIIELDGDTVEVSGAANLAGMINYFRSTGPTLALHAGDDYQGSPISTMTSGRSQVELLNIIRPDVYNLGNHEFDYGVDSLLATITDAEFPVLSGNTFRAGYDQPLFPADTVVSINGVEVGVIGVITEALLEETTEKATAGLEVRPAKPIIERSLDRLEPVSDVQIVLSHMGWAADSVLATQIGDRIDLIIGGHSHTIIQHPRYVNSVPIVQVGDRGRWLGIVKLDIDTVADRVVTATGRIQRVVTGAYPPDPYVAALVAEQEATLSKWVEEVVAELEDDWVRHELAESNVGQWIADAIREHVNADIAFINTGGLRNDILAGPLTIREIMEVAPFSNEITTFTLTGGQLRDYVRYEVTHPDRFLIPSGLTYEWDDGNIESIAVNGEAVPEDETYKIATLSYVTGHLGMFFGLDESEVDVETTYIIDRDALIEEAREDGVIAGTMTPRAIIDGE